MLQRACRKQRKCQIVLSQCVISSLDDKPLRSVIKHASHLAHMHALVPINISNNRSTGCHDNVSTAEHTV